MIPSKIEADFGRNAIVCLILFLSLNLIGEGSFAQTNQWTWISGDNTPNKAAVYGTKGVAAATNKPSSRAAQSGFMDASGNFWIFGGFDYNGNSNNDLWKFNPTAKQWTWVSGNNSVNNAGVYGTEGTAAAGNLPGSRYGQVQWRDASGNFWFFGGLGLDVYGRSGYLNDLWKYNSSTGQWTWVSGANQRNQAGTYGTMGTAAGSNSPGGREFASGWIDGSGNLWLFGGYGYDGLGWFIGDLDDLWKYNPTTGQWTWVNGDNVRNVAAVYGTKNVAAASNKPGNRDSHSTWTDGSGNFWLFGGYDYNNNDYNDLWKYSPVTGLWTWVGGANSQNRSGVYGVLGSGATTNSMGSRFGQSAAIDIGGNFIIFGGEGYDVNGNQGALNDLWAYTPGNASFTWTSGNNTQNNTGIYGTLGVAAATNQPGARYYSSLWIDASNNVWVFGGTDYYGNYYNDLWQFTSLTLLALQNLNVEGTAQGNQNVLSWQTENELNTSRFDVQRSSNAADFTTIGSVQAVGSGNNNYSYTDASLPAGNVFYRIAEQDKNDNVSYSKVIELNGSRSASFNVFPNPAKNSITIQFQDSRLLQTHARIVDLGGRLAMDLTLTDQNQWVDISRLVSGVYVIALETGEVARFLKL